MPSKTPFTLQLPPGCEITHIPVDCTDELIEFLNSLVKIDPYAMAELLCVKVPCNQALAEHPTVAVEPSGSATFIAPGTFRVGLLGILNGFCSKPSDKPTGYLTPIIPVYENGKLSHFKRATEGDVIEELLLRAKEKTVRKEPKAPNDRNADGSMETGARRLRTTMFGFCVLEELIEYFDGYRTWRKVPTTPEV